MADKAKENGKDQKKRSQRWSIGVFRRQTTGKLVTVYVDKEGTPMPYERERVGDNEILFFDVYRDMPYREARQQLLKAAAGAGHAYEVEVEKQADEPKKKGSSKTDGSKSKSK